ncbi:hypothetical protein ACFZA1_32060 [Streptomyces filipinensis]|uniref:hypothetical protein n=1 Tax=Streptomyces filipinensis TaxID=66887 RepID=UPI0036E8E75B
MADTTYDDVLGLIDEVAGRLDPGQRLARLFGLMAPLLDRVEREDQELSDDPVLSTSDAVRELRKAAAGEPADVDAAHEQLAEVGLCYSEDQAPERHLVSQSAYAAAPGRGCWRGGSCVPRHTWTTRIWSRRTPRRRSHGSSTFSPGPGRTRCTFTGRTP